MLKNLVKKFTSHSLNDGDANDSTSMPPAGFGAPSALPGVDMKSAATEATPAAATSPQFSHSHHHHLRRMPLGGAAVGNAATKGSAVPYTTVVKSQRRGRSMATVAPSFDGNGKNLSLANVGAVAMCEQRRRHPPPSLADSGISTVDDMRDSGTESDEELAVIETNSIRSVPVSLTSDYYTSQQSLSVSCRSSHCGSPLLDQDCASWDNFGCDSGGFARGNESAADLEAELPNHHYHTRQQFRRFLKYQQQKQQISSAGAGAICENACGGPFQHGVNFVRPSEAPEQKIGTRTGLRSLDHGLNQGGQDTPTVDECAVYNTQLASPSSSIDELESINGSTTLDQTDVAKTNEQETEFVVPDINAISRNVNRGRSSFTVCAKFTTSSNGRGVASSGTSSAEKRKWSQVQSADFSAQPTNQPRAFSGDTGASVGNPQSMAPNAATSLKIQVLGETGDFGNVAADGAIGGAAALPPKSAAVHLAAAPSGGGSVVGAPRRAPVRLLIAPSTTLVANVNVEGRSPSLASSPSSTAVVAGVSLPSAPSPLSTTPSSSTLKISPRKKCRAVGPTTPTSTSVRRQDATDETAPSSLTALFGERQRPSLNFDKMREGWNAGYQLRSSSHGDCLFQPLGFPPSPPNLQPNVGD